jgi:hypothetical protein
MGVREYGRTYNRDPSTVSRPLSCKEVPTWQFIEELISHIADSGDYSAAYKPHTLQRLRVKYDKALASSSAKGHVVQTLRADVARAQMEVFGRDAIIVRLTADLQETQDLNAGLKDQLLAFGRECESLPETRGGSGRPPVSSRQFGMVRLEQEAAESRILELQAQLAEERRFKDEALRRCDELTAQLREYLAAQEAAGLSTGLDAGEQDPSQSEVASVLQHRLMDAERNLEMAEEVTRRTSEERNLFMQLLDDATSALAGQQWAQMIMPQWARCQREGLMNAAREQAMRRRFVQTLTGGPGPEGWWDREEGNDWTGVDL